MILQGMSMRRAVLQCGPQPWPAQARKHPAVDGRAPQAASESPTDLLCHSERSEESFPLRTKGRGRTMPRKEEKDKRSAVKNLFWARLQMFRCAQHDGCSGSSQRSERQTKCSQESVYVYFYTDSSSIFRSPQNDNAVFALNHFLSGTHSSARPGRLQGSRF